MVMLVNGKYDGRRGGQRQPGGLGADAHVAPAGRVTATKRDKKGWAYLLSRPRAAPGFSRQRERWAAISILCRYLEPLGQQLPPAQSCPLEAPLKGASGRDFVPLAVSGTGGAHRFEVPEPLRIASAKRGIGPRFPARAGFWHVRGPSARPGPAQSCPLGLRFEIN